MQNKTQEGYMSALMSSRSNAQTNETQQESGKLSSGALKESLGINVAGNSKYMPEDKVIDIHFN